MNSFKIILVCVAMTLVSESATGQEKSQIDTIRYWLDPIVITATRREQPGQWVSDDHNVININRTQLSTSQTIPELLANSVPAQISDYGSGSSKNISLRGAGSERTLVLMDGKRIGTTDGDLGDISTETIEKIEIVEGGQSALYGMDAIGGIINIITKRSNSEKLSGNLSMAFSSFEPTTRKSGIHVNGKKMGFDIGKKFNRVEWLTGVNWQSSDGRFEYTDTNKIYRFRENNGFTNWEAYQKLRYEKDSLSLGAFARYCDRDIDNPSQMTTPSLANTKKKIGALSLDGSWALKKFLKLKLNSSYAHDNIHFVDPNPFWPQESKHARTREDLEFIQEFTLGRQMVNTGIEIFNDAIESNEIGNHSARQVGIFTNCIFSQSTPRYIFQATPAIRLDHSTLFNTTINGKIGVITSCKMVSRPSLFINVGSSFRSPSFNDLYWPQDAYTVGNPNLKPEKSKNWDAGFQLQGAFERMETNGRFTYFNMQLNDMILWEPNTTGIWSPKNIAAAKIDGFKIDVAFNYLKIWDFEFDFANNNAHDRSSNKILIYRPKYIITCSSQRFGNWFNAGISFRYSSKVYTNELNTSFLPSHILLNINAGFKILSRGASREGLWLVYDILNVTNQERSTNEGYPLPGREYRMSLKMKF
jgi:outer membrane receptor for ferrienterochelin and colicins